MDKYIFGKHKLYEMDCKSKERKWILEIYGKKYIVNEDTYKFIEKYNLEPFDKKTLDETEQLIFSALKNAGYFFDVEKPTCSKDYARLMFKKRLFSAKSLKHLKIFAFLFLKPIVIVILPLILLNIFFTYFNIYYLNNTNGEVASIIVLLLFSTIFHEIGHISASIKYGVIPKWAGVGIYFTSPIAFVDVDDTWKLPQKQRIVVDIGGIYFQLIISCIYALWYIIFKTSSALNAAYLLVVSVIFNLNPFLEYDGYWIFSDLLGVYNLNQHINESIRFLFCKLFYRKKCKQKHNEFDDNKSLLIGIYSLVSVIFFIYFGIALLKSSIISTWKLFKCFSVYNLFMSMVLLYFSVVSIDSLFRMLKDIVFLRQDNA